MQPLSDRDAKAPVGKLAGAVWFLEDEDFFGACYSQNA